VRRADTCPWGYLRRSGIGKDLEAAVDDELRHGDTLGTYLWFSAYYASASNFWPSLGYEPIWTSYQRRAPGDEDPLTIYQDLADGLSE
jgi:hypothetical protein